MLLEFGFKNFFSFREGCVVSLQLGENCPAEFKNNKGLAPVLCVKGANSAGKTVLLRALGFVQLFCPGSFREEPTDFISISPFGRNNDPISLYLKFISRGIEYCYELETTDKHVISEKIIRKKGKRSVLVIGREKDQIKVCIKEFERLKSMKLRSNASIISTAKHYGFSELDDVLHFFSSIWSNVTYGGRYGGMSTEMVSGILHRNAEVLKFVKEFLISIDTGISDIGILSREVSQPSGRTQLEYFPRFQHVSDGKTFDVFSQTESSGTLLLYRQLVLYKFVLSAGGLLVLDEFDLHLHPSLLPRLIEMFTDPALNPNNAQLIVSTHDTNIMDIFGRYRTYLVNKRDNESFAYRVDEIPGDIVRNDRSMVPAYRDGKLGGVPAV